MGIALKHAWNIAGKYALEPHGTVPRFLGTLGTVLSPVLSHSKNVHCSNDNPILKTNTMLLHAKL